MSMKKIFLLIAVMFSLFSLSAKTVIDVNDYFSAKTDNPKITTADGEFTITTAKGGASNVPIFSLGYNGADNDIRVYANGVFSVTSKTKKIQALQFEMSTQGLKRWADLAPSAGLVTIDVPNAITTWAGDTTYVDFTVGASAVHGTENTKAGQFCFKKITIYVEGDETPELPQADTVNVVVADIFYEYYEEYSEEGAYNYWLQIEDSATGYWLLFDLYAPTEGSLVGNYSFSADNLGSTDTYIYIDEDNDISVSDAKINITAAGDGYKIEASMTAADGNVYIVNYTGVVEEYIDNPYSYEPEEVSTITFNAAEISVSDYTDYGFAYVILDNDEGELVLEVNLSSLTDDDMIPDGTYTIDFSESDGTITASSGVSDGYASGSYFMTDFVEEEGETYPETVYFLVSGQAVVTSNGTGTKLTLTAKTYYGSTINAVYQPVSTGLESLSDKNKTVLYNVLGTPVGNDYNGIVIRDGKKFMKR